MSSSAPLGQRQGVQLPDHVLKVCLVLQEPSKLSSKWLYHFAFLPAMNEGSRCSYPCQQEYCQCSRFGTLQQLSSGISLLFILHFPDDIGCTRSFHSLIYHLYIFFGQLSLKVFSPVFYSGCLLSLVLRLICTFWITVFYQCLCKYIFLLYGLTSHFF